MISRILIMLVLVLLPSLAAAEDQLSQHQQEQVRQIIRQHLLENPDIVRDVIIELQRREEESVRTSRVDDIEANGDRLFNSDIDPIGGNPDGEITVVEFFDYNCPYCRRVKPIVKELLSKDNRIRYVFKEFPILGESSVQATQIALAIWKSAPDKYWAYHARLMQASSRLTENDIRAAVADVDLNWGTIVERAKQKDIDIQIRANLALASELQISGTPTFVIGDQVIPGFVPYEQLSAAVDQAAQ